MERARGYGDKLTGPHNHLAIRKLYDQFTIDPIKSLVRVRMVMPPKLGGHYAHPDFVIVDRGERDVLIRISNQPAECKRIDYVV